MAYVVESGTQEYNILESAEGLLTKTVEIPQSMGVDDGKYKIVKGGTPYPANDATATGLIYETVDVTDGPAIGALIVHGRVITERVTVADAAKTALEALGIEFIAAKETTRVNTES